MATKKQIEFAEQQLVGFAHARAGYDVEQLAESMGLTKHEWEVLKDRVRLSPHDENYLDAYFERHR